MDYTFLQVLWYFLIFLLIAIYFALDGFDLGIGVLYPALAKDEKEKAIAREAIGPIWDGNEVWLLTGGGALFAAFAPVYATTFSGFYLAIMLVLFGLIIRAVAVEYRSRDAAWSKFWDVCFVVGSLFPALLTGVAIGNVYKGIPMNMAGDYIGVPLFGLVTPWTLLCGLLGLAMMLAAGSAWISLKAPAKSELRARGQKMRRIFQIVALVLFVIASVYGHFVIAPEMVDSLAVARFACAGLFVVLVVAGIILGKQADKDLAVFIMQALASMMLVFLVACTMFPNMVVASPESIGPSLDIANSVAGDLTLFWMTIIAVIGVTIVICYQSYTYYLFRGRIDENELNY